MRFTVISAVLNGGPALRSTVNSVLGQSHADWEIIVQDGGSSDGCLDFLEPLQDARIRIFREPDSGIYDAWNKAAAKAEGEWAIFLGAGDALLGPDVLARCAACLENAPPQTLFAYGDLFMGKNGRARCRVSRSLRTVYSMMLTEMGMPFTAAFVRLTAIKALGFDPSYRICGDYDLTARALSRDNILRLPFGVSFMEDGGVSGNDAFTPLLTEERRRVAQTHIMGKAEEIAAGAVARLEESACCGARKKIRGLGRFFGRRYTS